MAAAGMKLAREAATPEGQVLCGPGTELSADLIQRLEKQGVMILTVEGHPVKMPGELSLAERLRELDRRFSKVAGDPVLKALKNLIAEYWIVQEKGEDYLQELKKRISS